MTEKESAHPLSPSVDVDIGKTVTGNGHQVVTVEAVTEVETPVATAVKQKSIVPV